MFVTSSYHPFIIPQKQSVGPAGISLTESCAMNPRAAVSGYYFSHPLVRYFGVAEIGRDQVKRTTLTAKA
ncbi:hypothetical protein BH23ACT11_BH23ACT11_14500 [soil metagenome]